MFLLSALLGGLLALLMATLTYVFGVRLADRLPGEHYWPECLFCQRRLSWLDWLPGIAWLRPSRLRQLSCPCGRRSKQWQRPALELSALVLGALAGAMAGWSVQLVFVVLAIGLLLSIALVDGEFGIIPDTHNVLLALLGLGWLLAGGGDLTVGLVVSGALLALGLLLAIGYSKLRGKEMLGLGDVKYFAAVGLWLTPVALPWFLMMAGVLGAIIAVIWQRVTGEEQSPFGPALVITTLVYLFAELAQSIS